MKDKPLFTHPSKLVVNYIFDLDGTLVDTVDLHAATFMQAFREGGKEASLDQIKALIGISGIEIAKKLGAGDPAGLYKRKVELFIERIDEVKEMKGATQTIAELKKRGRIVCIATSSGKKMTQAILKKFNWPLDMVVTAEEVMHGKPNPEMLQKIIDKFGRPALVIGDTEYDREMAKRCGLDSYILGKNLSKLEDVLEMDKNLYPSKKH